MDKQRERQKRVRESERERVRRSLACLLALLFPVDQIVKLQLPRIALALMLRSVSAKCAIVAHHLSALIPVMHLCYC